MNKERQCTMIAEACGWKNIHFRGVSWNLYGIPPSLIDGCGYNPLDGHWPIPRYTADLNAMNEAERTLVSRQREEYARCLLDITNHDLHEYDGEVQWDTIFEIAASAPHQRAEAFLRTLGKWEENPA